MESNRSQEAETTRQCRIRHQWHQRILLECFEQRLQRRNCVARRCLLPREAFHLRRLRGTPQLHPSHQQRHQAVMEL